MNNERPSYLYSPMDKGNSWWPDDPPKKVDQFALQIRTVEEVIYAEPKGNDIMDVFQWFKNGGFGENWVFGGNEKLLARDLVNFSRGVPTDFLVWNCIGFKWYKDPKGGPPTCDISAGLDTSMSIYYQDKIQEMAEMLSFIGEPKISVVLPSNEAFDDRVFRYRQPKEERERIINEAVQGIQDNFDKLVVPDNTTIQAVRWDEFLKKRGAKKSPMQYSYDGEGKIKYSKDFDKISKEAVKSGRRYFAQIGITNITRDDLLLAQQIPYYGVYVGEGIAEKELQDQGGNVVVVNFEEMRVSQMAFMGADEDVSIVTPIKKQEMDKYYRYKNERVERA